MVETVILEPTFIREAANGRLEPIVLKNSLFLTP
jgi:hypothetical protein